MKTLPTPDWLLSRPNYSPERYTSPGSASPHHDLPHTPSAIDALQAEISTLPPGVSPVLIFDLTSQSFRNDFQSILMEIRRLHKDIETMTTSGYFNPGKLGINLLDESKQYIVIGDLCLFFDVPGDRDLIHGASYGWLDHLKEAKHKPIVITPTPGDFIPAEFSESLRFFYSTPRPNLRGTSNPPKRSPEEEKAATI